MHSHEFHLPCNIMETYIKRTDRSFRDHEYADVKELYPEWENHFDELVELVKMLNNNTTPVNHFEGGSGVQVSKVTSQTQRNKYSDICKVLIRIAQTNRKWTYFELALVERILSTTVIQRASTFFWLRIYDFNGTVDQFNLTFKAV